MDFSEPSEFSGDSKAISLSPDTYVDVDMGKNRVGLFELELDVKEDGEFFVILLEITDKW